MSSNFHAEPRPPNRIPTLVTRAARRTRRTNTHTCFNGRRRRRPGAALRSSDDRNSAQVGKSASRSWAVIAGWRPVLATSPPIKPLALRRRIRTPSSIRHPTASSQAAPLRVLRRRSSLLINALPAPEDCSPSERLMRKGPGNRRWQCRSGRGDDAVAEERRTRRRHRSALDSVHRCHLA